VSELDVGKVASPSLAGSVYGPIRSLRPAHSLSTDAFFVRTGKRICLKTNVGLSRVEHVAYFVGFYSRAIRCALARAYGNSLGRHVRVHESVGTLLRLQRRLFVVGDVMP
jgi:hypothetical protein